MSATPCPHDLTESLYCKLCGERNPEAEPKPDHAGEWRHETSWDDYPDGPRGE